MYVVQEEPDEDGGSDLLNVCTHFSFKVSSYDQIGRVTIEQASPPVQL